MNKGQCVRVLRRVFGGREEEEDGRLVRRSIVRTKKVKVILLQARFGPEGG